MFYDNQICMHGNVKVCFNTDKYKCMRNWMLREKGVSWLVYMGKSRLHTLCCLFLQRNNFGILLFSAKAVIVCCWLLERNTFCVVLECKGWRFVFICLMVIKTHIIVHYRADCFRESKHNARFKLHRVND